MAISGVIIVMTPDADDVRLLATLQSHAHITLGPRAAHRQAAVIDTPSPYDDEDVHRWIESLPGVSVVEVSCVYLSDEPAPPSGTGITSELFVPTSSELASAASELL